MPSCRSHKLNFIFPPTTTNNSNKINSKPIPTNKIKQQKQISVVPDLTCLSLPRLSSGQTFRQPIGSWGTYSSIVQSKRSGWYDHGWAHLVIPIHPQHVHDAVLAHHPYRSLIIRELSRSDCLNQSLDVSYDSVIVLNRSLTNLCRRVHNDHGGLQHNDCWAWSIDLAPA